MNLTELEKKIDIYFENKDILVLSLTHKSYSVEKSLDNNLNNERLEFLGDSVLSIIVSTYLYDKYPLLQEGDLSKYRAKIISKEYCYIWAKQLDLGAHLLLGKGEENSGGREKISNLANTFESLLGAIYLAKGIKTAEDFMMRFLTDINLDLTEDYKSELQEAVQKLYKNTPIYKVESEKGPAHNKIFKISVTVENKIIGHGEGNSKKSAEQLAAKDALTNTDLNKENNNGNNEI